MNEFSSKIGRYILISRFGHVTSFSPNILLNSITGVFKNLLLEFEKQLKVVIQHFEESDDYKFTAAYAVKKLNELLDVHISQSQCKRYLVRLHNLVKPGSRALIKFTSKKARVKVNNNLSCRPLFDPGSFICLLWEAPTEHMIQDIYSFANMSFLRK